MARSRDSVLDAIKALMSKTVECGCTPEEAAAAATKVSELLARHNIDIREALLHDEEASAPIECVKFSFSWQSYYDLWRRNLLRTVIRYNFCRVVWSDNKTVANIIGQRHNEEVVEYLFTYLSRAIFDMATDYFDKYKRDNGLRYEDVTAKFAVETKMAFCDGAIETLDVRLKLMAESVDANIRALVLSVDQDLQKATRQFFPYLTHSPEQGYRQDGSAYAAGQRAGTDIGLRHGVNTGSGFTRQLGSGR